MHKVLYIAAGWTGSTAIDRKKGLISAGWNIIHFDTDSWMKHPWRLWRGIHHRLSTGPLIWGFNRAILREAKRVNPDIVWVDKGIWVGPRTIRQLKKSGSLVVHFTPDSPLHHFHDTSRFLRTIRHYDLMFTTKRWDADVYQQNHVKKLIYCQKSTCPSRTRPLKPCREEACNYETDLVFIGHAEDHYCNAIRRLVVLCPNIRLKIWGAWGEVVKQYPELAPYWQGRGAFGDEYSMALTSAKIGLGLLTRLVPETETARSFEIPACGTFLLAERTKSHLSLFAEGREAEFFDSPEEAAEKITYYLRNEAERTAIAEAGYRRFIESDYTTGRFMRDCAREVEALLGSP